jgi:hypothetical protein
MIEKMNNGKIEMSQRTNNSRDYICLLQSAQRICSIQLLKRRTQLRHGNAPTGSSVLKTPTLLWKIVRFGWQLIAIPTLAYLNGSESASISTG